MQSKDLRTLNWYCTKIGAKVPPFRFAPVGMTGAFEFCTTLRQFLRCTLSVSLTLDSSPKGGAKAGCARKGALASPSGRGVGYADGEGTAPKPAQPSPKSQKSMSS